MIFAKYDRYNINLFWADFGYFKPAHYNENLVLLHPCWLSHRGLVLDNHHHYMKCLQIPNRQTRKCL